MEVDTGGVEDGDDEKYINTFERSSVGVDDGSRNFGYIPIVLYGQIHFQVIPIHKSSNNINIENISLVVSTTDTTSVFSVIFLPIQSNAASGFISPF